MAAGNHVTSVLNQFSRLVCPLLRLWRYEVRTYVYWNVLMCISHLLRARCAGRSPQLPSPLPPHSHGYPHLPSLVMLQGVLLKVNSLSILCDHVMVFRVCLGP